MPNPFILRGVSQAWSKEAGRTKRVLDLILFSDNMVVKARKKTDDENRLGQ